MWLSGRDLSHSEVNWYIYIYAFSRRFYPKRLTIEFRLYIFISTCVPWESNPQPFALLTQCSTTEPHRNIVQLLNLNWFEVANNINCKVNWNSKRSMDQFELEKQSLSKHTLNDGLKTILIECFESRWRCMIQRFCRNHGCPTVSFPIDFPIYIFNHSV